MAVIIEANYSKKVGLPNFSSHQYSVTLRTEISDLGHLEKANAELYGKLQAAVDSQIVNPGLVPGGSSDGTSAHGQVTPASRPAGNNEDVWNCSDKQRDLILKLVGEHNLDKNEVESLAQRRFGTGVRQLDKLQASGLIDELIETHGGAAAGNGRGQGSRRGYTRAGFTGRGRQ